MFGFLNKIKLRRITSGGKFIPAIDGLRFITIAPLVLFHIYGYLLHQNTKEYLVPNFDQTTLMEYFTLVSYCVELFFVISGFILGVSFAKTYSSNKEFKVKNYFIRRITRVEPPYFVVMIGMFFLLVFLFGQLSVAEGTKSLGASLLYIHNFVYGLETYPLLNPVGWTLEIEVQFYILAPLLGLVFKITEKKKRIFIIIAVTILGAFIRNYNTFPFISIMHFIPYFGIGFLLAEFFVNEDKKEYCSRQLLPLISIFCLMSIYLLEKRFDLYQGEYARLYITIADIIQVALTGVFFYNVLLLGSMSLLKHPIVTNIGGMCYSIYLIHGPIISFIGLFLLKLRITDYQLVDNLIFLIIIFGFVLTISGIFYLLIERPCMKRDWHKDLWNKITTSSYAPSWLKR